MTPRPYSRIVDVAVYLPEDRLSSAAVEARIQEVNPGLDLPGGLIERLTGVAYRHVRPAGWVASDLAVAAARKLLADVGREPAEIDLILFASVSTDVLEPATGHIVAQKLGATCPVIDVKNACNAVANALEVGDALIRTGAYRRILIACGESASQGWRWQVDSVDQYLEALGSFGLSDAGAALLLEGSEEPGILGHRFSASSQAWEASVLPLSPTVDGGWEVGRFRVRPVRLAAAVASLDFGVIHQTLAELDLTMDSFAAVAVNQVSLPYLTKLSADLGIDRDLIDVVVAEHGNLSAACIPLQLNQAVRQVRVRRGDLVALIGMASGLSIGIVVVKW